MSNSELLDIVNEDDEVVGQTTRDECHTNPKLIHRTVHFTLFDKTTHKIFLHQRSIHKLHDPGKICFFGEHVKSGESYERAFIRGVVEEVGFTPTKYIEIGQHLFPQETQTELVKFYVVLWEGQDINIDSSEIEKIFWYSQFELINNISTYSDMTRYWADIIKSNLPKISKL